MKLVDAEYTFDGSRLTFYFTADERVDFRALVRDLSSTFRTRIELRQIGARDQAKLQSGVGPCGKTLCCSSWISDFGVVSIKMAKEQDLPLNPAKISGVCGRLLCCLSYENDNYIQAKQTMPPVGSYLDTPDGPGKVVSHNVPRSSVGVMLESGVTIQVPWIKKNRWVDAAVVAPKEAVVAAVVRPAVSVARPAVALVLAQPKGGDVG
jgi:cell fate regulator YaaT (PSP1 superfamily)